MAFGKTPGITGFKSATLRRNWPLMTAQLARIPRFMGGTISTNTENGAFSQDTATAGLRLHLWAGRLFQWGSGAGISLGDTRGYPRSHGAGFRTITVHGTIIPATATSGHRGTC